jgi:hypothetical protein
MDDRLDAEVEDRVPYWLAARRAAQGFRFVPEFSRANGETDDRKLLADVAFNRHSMNDGEHVSPTDNAKIQVGVDGIKVALVQGINEDDFKRTTSAATRATIGLDMDGVIEAEGDWEEMLKGGLQTALESQVIVFAVGGVSRTCTHQLVRSRRAAFHQQSQRAGYMGDAPEVRMPESWWDKPVARNAFFRATMACWKAYRIASEEGISYQDARFVLQEGTTNFILLEYPLREFLNVYAYRGCSMFQWEIVHSMREMRRVLLEAHPWLEPYVKISCEKTGPAVIPLSAVRPVERGESAGDDDIPMTTVEHHCTFQGWEDVEGQCDFPWAKQEARTFKPAFHRITREAK